MAFIRLDLTGDATLQAALAKLPEEVAAKAAKAAARRAMQPVLQRVRDRVQSGARMSEEARESLASSMLLKAKAYRKTGTQVVLVGPADKRVPHTRGRIRRGAYYWLNWVHLAHFFERGVRPHSTTTKRLVSRAKHIRGRAWKRLHPGGMHPGLPASPFIGPAYEESKSLVQARYRDEVLRGLEKAWKRLAGKGGT